jgi:2-succinyl-5-enolpyruvyl-6-hydroxy-3-cyclohexene-1-carboxylate synthase
LKQVTAPCQEGWFESFKQREISTTPATDAWHIPLLLASAQANSAIFIGNSLAIRNLDSDSGTGEKPLHFYANRGASGIDGNIATAAGLAAIHGSVIALLGDLSTQHDLGSLALAQGRDMTIVVVNNGGGGIFDYLPQAQLPEFERGWRTPQVIDFKHAALSFDLAYQRCDTAETFTQALAESQQVGGPHLIELQIN